MGERRPIIIDTDPGIDDAVAILLALRSPEFDIRAITTVAGNIGLAVTTRNALRILALAGRPDIPVHAGAAAPLVRASFGAPDIHGDDGLGGVAFPEPPSAPASADAVGAMAAILAAEVSGSVDILALGPLTNVALLLRDHPEEARRIGRIVAMGGAIREPGNMGPNKRAEFNLFCDPEAADAVIKSKITLILIPLDVTRKVRATKQDTAALRASGKAAAVASADLIDAYFVATEIHSQVAESRPLHDPCVILCAIDEILFGIETFRLAVDTSSNPDAGALTIADHGASVDVAMTVDGDRVLAVLKGRLQA